MSGRRNMNLSCSFCGKRQSEVKTLIAGPTVYICDQCIATYAATFAERMVPLDAPSPAPAQVKVSAAPDAEDAVRLGAAVVFVPVQRPEPFPTAGAVWSAIAPYLERDMRVRHALTLANPSRDGTLTSGILIVLDRPKTG